MLSIQEGECVFVSTVFIVIENFEEMKHSAREPVYLPGAWLVMNEVSKGSQDESESLCSEFKASSPSVQSVLCFRRGHKGIASFSILNGRDLFLIVLRCSTHR